jgi:hypothetical protein
MGKISSVPSWEIPGEQRLGWLGLVHGVGEAWRRRRPRRGAGTGILGSDRLRASSNGTVAQSSGYMGLWPGSRAGRRWLGHVWEIEKREERWAAA